MTGVTTVAASVSVHHMGAAAKAHHEVEQRGEQQQAE
jgi:hypothetical protein